MKLPLFVVIMITMMSKTINANPLLEFKAGISYNLNTQAAPSYEQVQPNDGKYDYGNPLGILRVEHQTDSGNTLFCEHISSLPSVERANGFNHCGFMIGL